MGMGKRRRRRRRRRCTVGLDWIFNPMVMGMGMGMGKKKKKRRRCGSSIFNPMGMVNHHHLLLLLPEDVLISILLCLPVKSLLRFKSVCKPWRKLIQSSFFIDLHTTTFNSSSSSKFGGTFILPTYEPDIKLFMLSSGDGDGDGEYDNEEDDDDQKKKKKKMVLKVDEDLGFSTIYKDFLLEDTLRMVGSCNGIICLHDPKVMNYHRGISKQHYSNIRDVSLWNPATRHFRILPKMITIEEKEHRAFYGPCDFVAFGFDVETKDYKVLRITPCDRVDSSKGGCMCRVQVYSLSTDSWRLLEDINLLPVRPKKIHGIYLNGSYFFVGTKTYTDDSMFLSKFDFTKEIFTTMQFPENVSRQDLVLSSLDEKLALFTYCDGYKYYDIWVLNEQQGSSGQGLVNKESSSWTKLHSFQIKSSRGPPHTKSRCISNNGEFALLSTTTMSIKDDDDRRWIRINKLQLFNLVTKEVLKDFTIGDRECRAAYVYKESLVSIMGGGNVLLRWQLPTHGTTYYKLNLDAPFIASYFPFGIGLCLTSDTGGCIGVRSLKRLVRDAREGEARAMLEAIKWAIKLELSPVIIESDSKNVVSFFMDDDDDDDDDDDNNSTYWSSEALSLLKEAKLLLNSSELGIFLKYCSRRSCNYVADIAAKLGWEHLEGWNCKDWSSANFSGKMVRSLSKDLGSETVETWWGGELGNG